MVLRTGVRLPSPPPIFFSDGLIHFGPVRSYFPVADWHVFEMCFILSTVNVACCVPPAGAPMLELVALEPDVVPVIFTSCPTWSLSFEVSPASW